MGKSCSNDQNPSISNLICTIFTSNGSQQLTVNASIEKASLFNARMLALYTTALQHFVNVLWYLSVMVSLVCATNGLVRKQASSFLGVTS